jgi:hypothetical protein
MLRLLGADLLLDLRVDEHLLGDRVPHEFDRDLLGHGLDHVRLPVGHRCLLVVAVRGRIRATLRLSPDARTGERSVSAPGR